MSVMMCDSVRELSGGLDDTRGSLHGVDDHGIVQALRDIETVSRQALSVMHDVIAEIDARGIAGREGFGSTARLVAGVLRLSAADARTRCDQARLLGARRSILGEELPPQLPVTAAALASGQIGAGQLRVITETMSSLPTSVPEPTREQVEADLAGHARDFDPRRLRIIAQRVVAHLDPDGPPPADDPTPQPPARGELWLRDRRDGRLGLEGWLAPEHGAIFRTLIEQFATPSPTTTDGTRDWRSVPQRQADALIEICDLARAAENCPTSAGETPHLTVTIDWDTLRTATAGTPTGANSSTNGAGIASRTSTRTAYLDHGQPISPGDARRLACDARIIPVVLGGDSEPLDVGRARRTAPRALRRALIARDQGCSFPGCHTPPQRCAVHHIQHWIDQGGTCITNCCLLCQMHHEQVHLQGWDLTVHGGQVEFRPPAIIDPDRQPLTNPLRR